jgi:hypothetical protein
MQVRSDIVLGDAQDQVGVAPEKLQVFLLGGAKMQKIIVLDFIEQRHFREEFAEDEELENLRKQLLPGALVDG